MHIPPYHKKATWQRFFVGVFVGSIIAYCLFVYIHGTMYGELLEGNRNLKAEVSELKDQNEALLEDNENLDQQSQEPLKIETIDITIANEDDLPDSLITHDLEEMIKDDIAHIIGKEVTVIAESDGLLKSTIEGKEYTVDDFTYQFFVDTLVIHETVKITVEADILT